MQYLKIRQLKKKLFFTLQEAAEVLEIKVSSARVICNRYTNKGIFIRIKNNFYVLRENWENLSTRDFFKLANFLQVPSYISFMTALSFYEVTTQVQRNFLESAAIKRSARFEVEKTVFNFYKIREEFYFDFIRDNGIFIASKEKAIVDSLYLYSLGKYKIDISSIDFKKVNKDKIRKITKIYPRKTRLVVDKLCRI